MLNTFLRNLRKLAPAEVQHTWRQLRARPRIQKAALARLGRTFNLDHPRTFDTMIEVARELAGEIPFCRVDLYDWRDSILFGEITFFPESGFGCIEPQEWDATWGNMLQLPVKNAYERFRIPRHRT